MLYNIYGLYFFAGGHAEKKIFAQKGGLTVPQVTVRPNETLDSALKRFKKVLQQAGTLKEAKEHERYEKPSDIRRKAETTRKRKMRRN